MSRDFGFAPNPFFSVCTLATCKPRIRGSANVGDIILGLSDKDSGARLIYAMYVENKMTFNEYWKHDDFQIKKPNLQNNRMRAFGDNIYHRDTDGDPWIQEDSHHSNPDGTQNLRNLRTDTSQPFVLISRRYGYWGRDALEIPIELRTPGIKDSINPARFDRTIFSDQFIEKVDRWVRELPLVGRQGEPRDWMKPHPNNDFPNK